MKGQQVGPCLYWLYFHDFGSGTGWHVRQARFDMRHVRYRAGAQRVVGRSMARLEPGVGGRQMKGRQVREKAQQDPTRKRIKD